MRVQFYLGRPKVKTKKGAISNPEETFIAANIHVGGKLMRIGTGLSVEPKYWNPKTHRAKITPSFRGASSLNALLDDIRGRILKAYFDYKSAHNSDPSQGTFKQLLNVALERSKTEKMTFMEYAQDFIDRTRNGQRLTAKGTIIKPEKAKYYGSTLNSLKEFNRAWGKTLDFDTIDLDFYGDYTQWMRRAGYTENYIGGHIKDIKAILNEATEKGVNTNLAYKSKRFIKTSEDVDNIALTEAELKDIQNINLAGSPHLDRVRDLFLIGCYTGLRFSDFSRLTEENIQGNFIEIKQQKTGKPVAIPVHPVVRGIIVKYKGGIPPAISNQKMNDYLKDVCKQAPLLCGPASKTTTRGGMKTTVNYKKWELVSTHTARRTFATNAYKQKILTITIMAITGHHTEKSFLKYIKITPKEHAEIMAGMWNKQGKIKAVK